MQLLVSLKRSRPFESTETLHKYVCGFYESTPVKMFAVPSSATSPRDDTGEFKWDKSLWDGYYRILYESLVTSRNGAYSCFRSHNENDECWSPIWNASSFCTLRRLYFQYGRIIQFAHTRRTRTEIVSYNSRQCYPSPREIVFGRIAVLETYARALKAPKTCSKSATTVNIFNDSVWILSKIFMVFFFFFYPS